jgi:galactose mutarotase-like enzyme
MLEVLGSERAIATVNPGDGDRLMSLEIDGKDIIGSPKFKTDQHEDGSMVCFGMGPYVGRLSQGKFTFKGTSY